MNLKNVILLVFSFYFSLNNYSQTVIEPSGSGTSVDPYLMSSLGNLYWLASESTKGAYWSLGKYFLQTNNIDASDTKNWEHTWIPIGGRNSVIPSNTSDETANTGGYPFYGKYNGAGYSIDGLVLVNTYPLNQLNGVFGALGQGAELINVNITNVSITTNSDKTGGLVAYAWKATIFNCSTSGIINSTGGAAGGISAQFQNSFMKNSYSTCTVKGTTSVGGLLGLLQTSSTGSVQDCFASGTVNGVSITATGGLMGGSDRGNYFRSYANCSVSTTNVNPSPGGFMGNVSYATAANSFCYWNSDVVTNGYNSNVNNYSFTPAGLTTSQLQDEDNFDDDWDFDNTWAFGSDGFPILVNLPNTWLGVDTNWNNTANWSFGVLPSLNALNAKDIVYIPAGLNNYPVLTGNKSVHTVTIEAGASLTTNSYTLTRSFFINKNSYTNTWTGAVNTDWSDLGNWSNNVVLSTYTTATIPTGLANYPEISTTTDVIIGSIVIESGASLNIAKGGSLKLSDNFTNNGTVVLHSDEDEFSSIKVGKLSSGNITYNRYVNSVSGGWDLIGSPVSGLPFSTFIGNTNIATNGSFYAIGSYDNTTDTWTNATNATSGNLQLGQGYQMATTSGGTLSFTGIVPTADVTIAIQNNDAANSGAGRRWNLIANPFPSYINGNSVADATNNFLTINTSVIDDTFEAIYGWNSTGYTIYNNTSLATYIAPGQGFFVAATSTSLANVRFTEAMQTIAGTDDFIAAKTSATSYELVLEMHQDTKKLGDTKFYFKEGLTLGLDPGYDAGAFNQGSALSSRLLAQDNGINMGINAMSLDHMNSVTVPLVINQEAGSPFAIRIANHTLPSDINVYVEDVVEKTVTLVTAQSFSLTPQTKLSGIGRFYLHFTRSSLSVESIVNTSLITAYKGNGNDYISIEGLQPFSKASKIILYNLLGVKIIDTTLNTPSQKEMISTAGIKQGIYILEINYDNQVLTKKIVID